MFPAMAWQQKNSSGAVRATWSSLSNAPKYEQSSGLSNNHSPPPWGSFTTTPATPDILTMTCLASCVVSTTGSRADRSARNSRTRFPIIGATVRLKLLTLHDPPDIRPGNFDPQQA